jgi:hypothetical protein
MKRWIFNVKKRFRDSKRMMRMRVVDEFKKEVEVFSLGKLKDFTDEKKK